MPCPWPAEGSLVYPPCVPRTLHIKMELQNAYFLIRHGRSAANEADLVVSSLVRVEAHWRPLGTGRARHTVTAAHLPGGLNACTPASTKS